MTAPRIRCGTRSTTTIRGRAEPVSRRRHSASRPDRTGNRRLGRVPGCPDQRSLCRRGQEGIRAAEGAFADHSPAARHRRRDGGHRQGTGAEGSVRRCRAKPDRGGSGADRRPLTFGAVEEIEQMPARYKSVETKYMEERDRVLRALRKLDRRTFLQVSAAAAGAVAAKGLVTPHSFQLVEVANAAVDKKWAQTGEKGNPPFTFAYISDTHLYTKELNERFVRGALKAVEDVNALDPQPDFVLFGGDLAQLGKPVELELGRQILKGVKAPVKMMVGEHDWFLDMGEKWRELFGPDSYSFDHKGVHFVVLMSVFERDFWTARHMSPDERMHTVAGLDNGTQSGFGVGAAGRKTRLDPVAEPRHRVHPFVR